MKEGQRRKANKTKDETGTREKGERKMTNKKMCVRIMELHRVM